MSVNTYFKINGKDVSGEVFLGIGDQNRSGIGWEEELTFKTKHEFLEWFPKYREQFIKNYDGDICRFSDEKYNLILKNLEKFEDESEFYVWIW